jgi:serine/threonine-protein kinase RsbW
MAETQNNGLASATGGPQVTLTIPCTAEYVGTVRLTVMGVASRLKLSIDQVEDVKMAVGEACTHAIERLRQRGTPGANQSPTITVRSYHEADRLILEVEDNVAGLPAGRPEPSPLEGVDTQEIGARLMEILVDEYAMEERPGGLTVVRLVKSLADGIA